MQQAAAYAVLEGLVRPGGDGRAMPWLADRWSISPDSLKWVFHIREGATFHDGSPLDAKAVRDTLESQLPNTLGPAFEDIREVRVLSETELEVALKQPSAFLIEALDVPIRKHDSPTDGSGAFYLEKTADQTIELTASDNYYLGRPAIDKIVMRPYPSARAAWAELLRGQLDMLYEVGLEAYDSLQPSRSVSIFRMRSSYQHMLILNVDKPQLRSAKVRQAINASIDRNRLVAEGLDGHATAADGPVWPDHWAYDSAVGQGVYDPTPLGTAAHPLTIKCLFGADASRERLALALQKQLVEVGVDLQLEALPPETVVAEWEAGDFDAILSDFVQGPNLVRPYLVLAHGRSSQLWTLQRRGRGHGAGRHSARHERR